MLQCPTLVQSEICANSRASLAWLDLYILFFKSMQQGQPLRTLDTTRRVMSEDPNKRSKDANS